MLAWLSENLATVIICAALIAVIAAIVIRLILNKSSCGCGCDNCPMGGSCHQDPKGNG